MTQLSTQTQHTPIATLMSEAQMSSKEITDLVGLRHDNVKRTIKTLIDKGIISQPQIEDGIKSANGVIEKVYNFSGEDGRLDSITVVAKLSPEFTKALVKRWDELEKQNSIVIPDFNNPALAARAWAEQYEQRYVAEQQRDHAIATKAEIGSRREATAMATASKEKRRADKLEIELDKSKEWITVKRAEMLCHGQKFNWRELKSTSIEMGYDIKKVFDENYGKINAYHRDVWQETYALDF